MLTIKREQSASGVTLTFSGVIDEASDLPGLIGALTGKVTLNCKEVTRINSVGVKAWITFFQGAVAKGATLSFVEASPAIVGQINLVKSFACGGRFESVYAPFVCGKCKNVFNMLFEVEALKKSGFDLPAQKCPKCGTASELDDIPDEYFRFASK